MVFPRPASALVALALLLLVALMTVWNSPQPSLAHRAYDHEHGQHQAEAAQAAATTIYLPLVRGGQQPAATSKPTLVKGYVVRGPQPDYEIVRYRPRQFVAGLDTDETDQVVRIDDPGAYAGWDLFVPPNRQISTILNLTDWVTLTLNRSTRVAIAWRGGMPLPAWLSGWEQGAAVMIDGERVPTYVRTVEAGDLQLGAVYDPGTASNPSRKTYLVLLAESDGKPSLAPNVAAGREAPKPNTTCPAWVHGQYTALAPDGKSYPTWHPQIDPVYWCYFHHEHGSDPAPYKPAFGYSMAQHGGPEERHEGFKVYRFNGSNGVEVIATHHFGTASASRAACIRFHTLDLIVAKGGSLVADVHLMGDHGQAVHHASGEPLTPASCPGQAAAALADGSNGVRRFQVATLSPIGYEPWRTDVAKVIVGDLDEFMVNTPSRIADCDSLTCDGDVATGDQGEFRFVQYGGGFGIQAGQRTGEFYTDATGRRFMNAGEVGAVRQFVAPGANATLPPLPAADVECYIVSPFGGPYVCQQTSPLDEHMNVENALRSPN